MRQNIEQAHIYSYFYNRYKEQALKLGLQIEVLISKIVIEVDNDQIKSYSNYELNKYSALKDEWIHRNEIPIGYDNLLDENMNPEIYYKFDPKVVDQDLCLYFIGWLRNRNSNNYDENRFSNTIFTQIENIFNLIKVSSSQEDSQVYLNLWRNIIKSIYEDESKPFFNTYNIEKLIDDEAYENLQKIFN